MQAPGIPENEEQRLKSLYITSLLDTRDDERFERLTRLARKAFQVPVTLISLLDLERQWLLACQGIGVTYPSADMPFCRRGPSSFTMRRLMSGSTTIHLSPVSLPDGTLCLIHTSPRTFTEEDIASLRDLACIVEDKFLAISMVMTGIPNRRGFYRAGEKLFRSMNWHEATFSLIYFDLDKFKPVNDLWGHAEGDKVLTADLGLVRQPGKGRSGLYGGA